MVQIQNADAIQALVKAARLPNSSFAPSELGKTIMPVIDMTPYFQRNSTTVATVATSTGTATILTSSATRETYITSINFSMIKDATCDVATGSLLISTTIGGIVVNLTRMPVITLTAQQWQGLNITLPFPILIDKNTVVSMTGTFTVGVMVRTASIAYFEIDTL